ncbi:SRPBCC domain-containing protein [Rathayibacter sp. YIM 133350]|uniref:SRPBCC domain-containing protein n=1 Tax=Rathayibacter sp. YIM 133350 TaxID=3131992 RepID=UPI00307ECBA0
MASRREMGSGVQGVAFLQDEGGAASVPSDATTGTTKGRTMADFEMSLYIAATPDQVWEAIVGDEANRVLMFGSVLRGDLAEGSRYEYVGPGQDGDETVHVYGEVLEVEPRRILSLSEHPGPTYRENHAELRSRMTWSLESATEEITQLRFVNDDWSPGHPAEQETSETWPRVLSSMKTWLETGRALDFGW